MDFFASNHVLSSLPVSTSVKDGGAFLAFAYEDPSTDADSNEGPVTTNAERATDDALLNIEKAIKTGFKKQHGRGFRMNLGSLVTLSMWSRTPSVHVVRGRPWREDMNRFPSSRIRLTFNPSSASGSGRLPSEEEVWELLRPYGRIVNIDSSASKAGAAGVTDAIITFARLRSATSARNCIHGITLSSGYSLACEYKPTLRSHIVWGWITNHPRIVLPVIAFVLGGITFAVFDPIRAFFVESKLAHTFELEDYRVYAWLRNTTLGSLLLGSSDANSTAQKGVTKGPVAGTAETREDTWWERRTAVENIDAWLHEQPSTFITISGPRGSGKHQLLRRSIFGSSHGHRQYLVLDCEAIGRTGNKSDAQLVAALACETGYWPVFGWLSSLNNLIDLAAVGLIGSKAGFSTPVDAQLRQVLAIATSALTHAKEQSEQRRLQERQRLEKKRRHLGRKSNSNDHSTTSGNTSATEDENIARSMTQADVDSYDNANRSYDAPVVILDQFYYKGIKSPLLWQTLSEWATELVTNRIAHVVFVTDNPVPTTKELSRALPNVPFNSVTLSDADQERARSYVLSKLQELGHLDATAGATAPVGATGGGVRSAFRTLTGASSNDVNATNGKEPDVAAPATLDAETAAWVDKLGGRLTDLENLIQKVSLGHNVRSAVEDIIARTVVELRKNAFGDDVEDATALPWTREQAWTVVSQLAAKGEVSYYALLHDDFKGDEKAIKALEQAEIVSVRHADSRPSVLRAGRPVLQHAMVRLVADPVFSDVQRFLSNNATSKSAETAVHSAEDELNKLAQAPAAAGNVIKSSDAARKRIEYLLENLSMLQAKISNAEEANTQLKARLAAHLETSDV